jgi:hypothetical protein
MTRFQMKIRKTLLRMVVLTALAVTSAYAQSSTTRQIHLVGTTSLRPVTSTGPDLTDFDSIQLEKHDASDSDDGGGGNGPGPAVAAASARIADSNPELRLSFDGLRMIDSRLADNRNTFFFDPPDQGLCAGNGFVLESVNSAIRVYDSDGNALSGVTSLNTFYGYPPAFNRTTGEFGPYIADPVCYFDQDIQRWFHVILVDDRVGTTSAIAGTNRLDVAVSQTSNPLGAWNIFKIPTQDDGTEGTPNHNCGGPCFADYDKIGADANGVYITTNEFPFGGTIRSAQIYAMSKRALAASLGPVTVIQFDASDPALLLDGAPGFYIWPATAPAGGNSTAAGGTEYFLSAANLSGKATSFQAVPSSDNRLRIWALLNTQSLNTPDPAVVLRHGVVNVQTYSLAPEAGQKEGSVPLADCLNDATLPTPLGTGCWSFFFSKKPPGNERESQRITPSFTMTQVVYADGKLWGSLNTALDLGHGTNVGIAYFVLQPQISSGTVGGQVVKQGYLGLTDNHLLHPAIGVTAKGRGVIAFSLMGQDHFPSAAYATLDAVAGAGDIHIAAEGLGPDDGLTAYKAFVGQTPFAKWGDYGATAVDGDSIWIGSEYIGQACTFAEYAAVIPGGGCGLTRTSLGNWYTRITKITP